MDYFLKPIGLSGTAFPVDWWRAKHELHDAVYSGKRPVALVPGSCLIYYAVGTGGKLVGVGEVVGEAQTGFPIPPGMTPEWAEKFRWRVPVRVLHHCPADDGCPRLSDFDKTPMGPGSYKRVDEKKAARMIDAVAACARR
jgi:hypothetical protein